MTNYLRTLRYWRRELRRRFWLLVPHTCVENPRVRVGRWCTICAKCSGVMVRHDAKSAAAWWDDVR